MDAARRTALMAGDSEAIAAWYRTEHPRVYRLALGFLATPEEAEDLAQDAMLKILDRIADCRPETYQSWATSLVNNLCRDRLRQARRRSRHEEAVATEVEAPGPRPLPAPDAGLQQQDTIGLLTRALGLLTPREREVFVLCDLEQQAHAAAASILGVTISTVRSLLSLARRRLRQHLDPELLGLKA